MQRAFQFFDTDNEGLLDLAKFSVAMAKLSSDNFEDQADFIFFVLDLDGDGVLSKDEIAGFLNEFVGYFCILVRNTLNAEHAALVEAG